jgi:AraC-like DNA-binding protein
MEYIERPPHPELAAVVRTYWWLRGDAEAGVARRGAGGSCAADGSPELIVNLAEPWSRWRRTVRVRRSRRHSSSADPGPIRAHGRVALVAVRFEAHGAAPLVDAIGALTDRWTPLEALRSPSLRALPSALAGAADVPAQARLLDDALRAAFAGGTPVDVLVGDAVRAIRASHGAVEIDALARELGVTARTLQRRFAASAGLSPKSLARIVRFQRVFAAWRDDPQSLSRAALESGYFDQSHLVRDFRDFAGAPPAGFLAALPAHGTLRRRGAECEAEPHATAAAAALRPARAR